MSYVPIFPGCPTLKMGWPSFVLYQCYQSKVCSPILYCTRTDRLVSLLSIQCCMGGSWWSPWYKRKFSSRLYGDSRIYARKIASTNLKVLCKANRAGNWGPIYPHKWKILAPSPPRVTLPSLCPPPALFYLPQRSLGPFVASRPHVCHHAGLTCSLWYRCILWHICNTLRPVQVTFASLTEQLDYALCPWQIL